MTLSRTVLTSLAILVSTAPEAWTLQSECAEYDRVIYSKANDLRVDRGDGTATEVVRRVLPPDTQPSSDLLTLKKERSPQGTVFFVQAPETDRPGNTSVHIFGNKVHPLALRVNVSNHLYEVQPRWINEKLLSMQVWVGRIASWDLILDVETQKFIYAEGANYGSSILSCSEKMKLQEDRK
jgi:hypothetical protein